MAPKVDVKGKAGALRASGQGALPQVSFLDRAFPLWQDVTKVELEAPVATEKYDDLAGLVLPPETQIFLDTWKRPEELVLNFPDVPMIMTVPPPPPPETPGGKEGKGAGAAAAKATAVVLTRDLDGVLSAGHRTFEWLHAVFVMIMSAQKTIKPSEYLWELVYPKDKDGQATKSPNGKYKVKLYIMDGWRTVVVDDRIPVDLFGRPLLVNTRPIQLWPLLLSKAVLKVMASHRILHCGLPHQAAAFSLLTGWPQEDLLDPLSGTRVEGGRLFDRLEDAVRGNDERVERHAVAAVTLIKRSLPERPPPRLIVLVGPSGVGRGALLQRLLGELPDKFGLTVSHTSRPPREHELHGTDYFFSEVGGFREEAAAGRLLETAPVPSTRGVHLYGTSFATVREVAATGKLCLMGLDVQGVRSLRANKRIDGLYVFVAPPSLEELERRLRGRLKESESTIRKRLAWAAAEVERSRSVAGVIDHVVDNSGDTDAVFLGIKEAISTLSPIIRNRLHGLPAYVLDYADLIAPNLVEKPFLKPVIITGPSTGERRILMEQLVHEFPDVFAYPRYTTTCPYHEDALYRVDVGDIVPEQTEFELVRTRDGEEIRMSRPTYTSVPATEFSASAKAGTYLEWHTELFKHPFVARQWGVTSDALKEVIRAGRLPLVECETEGAEMLKRRGIDCLTIFLKPPSVDVYEERLRAHLTETDEEIASRVEMARREMDAAAAAGSPFDATIVNGETEVAYEELTRLISKCRPDIIIPEEERQAEPPPPPKQPVLVLCGPSSGGRSALARQLLNTFPDKFTAPGLTTDRKPAKGEVSTHALTFVGPKDLAKMVMEGQVAYQRAGEDKASGVTSITNAALLRVAGENKVAVLELPDYATVLPSLRLGAVMRDALYVFVASPGQMRDALMMQQAAAAATGAKSFKSSRGAAAGIDVEGALADLEQQAQSAAGTPELYDAVVRDDEIMDIISSVRMSLAAHVPHVVPPPYRPLVVAGAFGTGKRRLLGRLFDALPGRFAVPLITTTREPGPEDHDQEREGMTVVTREEAAGIIAADGFVLHREVLGDVYGTTLAAVKKVGASGRVPILEVDHVEDAVELRRRGFDASYLFIGMDDMGKLLLLINEELSANPPLGYELQDAVNQFFGAAKAEMASSREEGIFDEWVAYTPDTPDPSFIRLAEAVHRHYPDVVTRHFVWGYGRQLWDPEVRVHGHRPLRVIVMGPAASGKSTQCALLADHFGMPHINVGELIYEEVRTSSGLGLEAKEFMDASKTVPDRFFFELLAKRLAEPDCVAKGWLLDGFPHTEEQCAMLQSLGIMPDKVLFLEGDHATLLDRTRYRRYDPFTGKVYHMPEDGAEALSPPIRPEQEDGSLDTEVATRLVPRHDDSDENVSARLALADAHAASLRDAYEDILLRLDSSADPRVIFQHALDYLTLEARVPELQVVSSTSLKELQYVVATTLRYRRRQLLQMQQDDGRTYWVDSKEVLGTNAHCALLCQDPSMFPTSHQLRRVDTGKLSRVALLYVDSPEPVRLLASLFTGPQYGLLEDPQAPHGVLMLAGPAGVGKSTVLGMLLDAQAEQVELVPILTTRPPLRREPAARVLLMPPSVDGTGGEVAAGSSGLGPSTVGALATACCVSAEALDAAASAGQLLVACESWDGHRYGVSRAALAAVWAVGKLPVIEGPLELGLALKELSAQEPAPQPAPQPSAPAITTMEGSATELASSASVAPVLTVRVAYLSVEVGELDVRLRLQNQREETAVGACLEAAQREQARLQRITRDARTLAASKATSRNVSPQRQYSVRPSLTTKSSAPPAPPPPDLVLNATDGVIAFHAVKQLASDSWRRPREQVAGQLVLEAFDWRATRPGRTVQRLRTLMSNAALLELPRGRHVLRINSDPLFLHAVTFMSASPCTVGEYSQVMPMCAPDAHVAALEGHYPDVPPNCVGLLFRYHLSLPEAATVAAYLSINGEDMRAATRLLLVNRYGAMLLAVIRASGEVRALPSNRLHATPLQPNAGNAGYSLVAVYDTASRAVAEEGNYSLTVTSTAPLTGAVTEVSSHRSDAFVEKYRPNARLVLSRHVITTTVSTQLAAAATMEPRLPFNMVLQEAAPGREITWVGSAELPVLVAAHSNDGEAPGATVPSAAPEGYALVADTYLKPGKYLLTCYLDAAACPTGLQPDVMTGAMPGGAPVLLKLWVHPSSDERSCTVVSDNSLAKYVQGVYEKWNAAPVALIAQPAPGAGAKGAAKGAAVPAGSSMKTLAGPRQVVAAGMLERYAPGRRHLLHQTTGMAAAAAEGGAGIEADAPTGSTRVLRDGSVMTMDPSSQVKVLHSRPEVLLTAEQLAERQASASKAAAAEGVSRLSSVGKTLEASKGERAGFRARQASSFAEWRASLVRAQQEVASKRAAVAQAMKQAAEAAALEARPGSVLPKGGVVASRQALA
ncbi:Adenylate kinase, chloroplastic [Tetrabaena socialis]|uniref:adenylate kinase n=1 Tax=Tetrabaena socialis TaxID=47790 RepID=A0A2J7ZZC2_9CHLO|nr:Adenylate kinase, chloroplastic [Tetrabaena socialis]|eukprot:PNH05620.1 Adenylate kinase, chloroplastic [Tetrabaena socialis]